MKEKNVEAILYSTAGVAAMFVLLIAFYVVTSSFKTRVDLTAEKAYTLSAGTRHILGQTRFPGHPPLLLQPGRHARPSSSLTPRKSRTCSANTSRPAKGKIILEKYDPKPDSDAEDSARLNGVQGEPLEMGGDTHLSRPGHQPAR